ncbi:transposase [Kitasatospora sp. Ki12]
MARCPGETVMSGSVGGRAERTCHEPAPRRAADPTAWLIGFRRPYRRYERKADHLAAFASIAAALICHRRLST